MRFLPRNQKKDIGRVFFHCESRDRSGPVYGRRTSSQGVPVEMQVVKPQKLPILSCQFKHAEIAMVLYAKVEKLMVFMY